MAASTAKTINGSDLMVFIGGKSIAFATNHKLTISAEMLDNASKDHASGLWKGTTLKSLSWNMSSENLFAYDGEGKTAVDLLDVMTLGQAVDVVFTINKKGTAVENTIGLSVTEGGWIPTDTAGDIQLTGKAFVQNIDINAPNGDNATFSVQLEGTGELQKVTVA